ncbi:MAG: hypothetical protein E7542_03535 [Ruminococcaceae bacterium]|nr:hypothetical protein [Oscillospiraceae bacterium]
MAAKIRIKCPICKEASNIHFGTNICPECKKEIDIPADGCIYIYRQGSPFGVAGGFGIYINGEPYGYIGNKELLCLPLNYGTYNIHCAAGMNRRCRDMQVTLTPENNIAYTKVHMNPGFWSNTFVIEPVDPKLLDL